MTKIELPPTKSSLRKLKEDLSFAYEGYDLLNQKREILAIEIVRQIGEIRRVEAEFLDVLNNLYAAYSKAAVDMGSEIVTLKSSSEKRRYFLQIESVRLMGLKLPKIRVSIKKPRLASSLTGTTATYDRAKEQSTKVVEVLADYASITKSIILLSRELRKVQRKVNALEKIFIPQHEDAKKYISDRLEEMERDEVFVKKLIRQRASGEKDTL